MKISFNFEWDPPKGRSNFEKHGVLFGKKQFVMEVDMREEYDFSKAEKGKFFRANVNLNIPIYLEEDVADFVSRIATKKGMDRSAVVNALLREDQKLGEAME
jgi:hypothetical protein